MFSRSCYGNYDTGYTFGVFHKKGKGTIFGYYFHYILGCCFSPFQLSYIFPKSTVAK